MIKKIIKRAKNGYFRIIIHNAKHPHFVFIPENLLMSLKSQRVSQQSACTQ